MKNSGDWLLLIHSILKIQDKESLDLEITETDTKVNLTTRDQEIASRLSIALGSPTTLYANLRYEIKREDMPEAPSVFEESYPPLPLMENLLNLKVFEKIFAPDLIKAAGMQWDSEIKKDGSYLLYFEIKRPFEIIAEQQVKLYQGCLAAATFSELRKALTPGDGHVPLRMPIENIENSLGVIANHVDKILYITKDSEGSPIACFDIGLLCQCLTPPTFGAESMLVEEGQEQKFNIEIDKNHFISYLATVLQEGFVLQRIEASHSEGKQLAFPICFNMARTIPLENVISFVLDKSGSMAHCFKEYIQEVKAFIGELEAQSKSGKDFQNTTIRLRPFSDKSDEVKEFSLQAGTQAIFDYLDTLEADSTTYLNGTVADEFNALGSDLQNKNVTLVVFTDGADNVKTEESLQRLGEIKAELAKQSAPPKVFTFGLGEKYSEEGLRKLSEISGSEHTRLNIISEFKRGLTAHLDSYCKVTRLARFVQQQFELQEQELKERQITFDVRIKEGYVVRADQALVIPGAFSVNGESYVVTDVPAPRIQPSVETVQEISGSGSSSSCDVQQSLEIVRQTLGNKDNNSYGGRDALPEFVPFPPSAAPILHQYPYTAASQIKDEAIGVSKVNATEEQIPAPKTKRGLLDYCSLQ